LINAWLDFLNSSLSYQIFPFGRSLLIWSFVKNNYQYAIINASLNHQFPIAVY
jgi:hypothetical protein